MCVCVWGLDHGLIRCIGGQTWRHEFNLCMSLWWCLWACRSSGTERKYLSRFWRILSCTENDIDFLPFKKKTTNKTKLHSERLFRLLIYNYHQQLHLKVMLVHHSCDHSQYFTVLAFTWQRECRCILTLRDFYVVSEDLRRSCEGPPCLCLLFVFVKKTPALIMWLHLSLVPTRQQCRLATCRVLTWVVGLQ